MNVNPPEPPAPPDTGKRTRTAQACQRCRSLKARCPPSDHSGTCQRCLAANRPCVWPETQLHPKRNRVTGTSRIAQMEQKIDGLVGLLSERSSSITAPSQPQPAPSEVSPRHSRPTPTGSASHQSPVRVGSQSSGTPQDPLHELRELHKFDDTPTEHHGAASTHRPVFHPALIEPSINHDVVRILLDNGRADSLLNHYRAMTIFFPFVPIPPNTNAHSLSQQKPMLLLAILTTASGKDRPLQLTLEEQYRLELASRTIIRPRKTLSMIQSILVYLAWYHFHFTPQTHQIHSLLQLALGLVIDLGFYQKSKKPLIDINGQPKPSNLTPSEERETQRTLLGCYYLSSAFSAAFPKPNLFQHTDYMTECAQRLRDDLEFSSDDIIPHLVHLRRLDDKVYETFLSEEAQFNSEARSQMHLKLLQPQLEQWKNQRWDESFHQVCELSYYFSTMSLHSFRMRMDTNKTNSTANADHLDTLLSCLESGRQFLDKILSVPVSDYHYISFVEWMRLPYVLIIVARLSFPNENHIPGWDVRAAQDRVRLDLYLESLCYRMQNLTTFNRVTQPNPDFWLSLSMIMEKTKLWYLRKTRPATDSGSIPGSATASGLNEESPLEHIQDPTQHMERAEGLSPTHQYSMATASHHGHGAVTTAAYGSGHPVVHMVQQQQEQPPMEMEGVVASPNMGMGISMSMDPFAAMPDFDNLEDFLDGGLWGGGGFDASMLFPNEDMGF